MKLLFDENLSHYLVGMLEVLFPRSIHVRDVGLERADDRAISSASPARPEPAR